MIVSSMAKLKAQTGIPYSVQCSAHGTAYSSTMRWRSRIKRTREPVMAPGPKKIEPLDLNALTDRINELRHGRKRTAGTGALYELASAQISRRELQALVTEARRQENRDRRAREYRIEWNCPGLVWAMDDTEYPGPDDKRNIHTLRDLGSRYTFEPFTGIGLPCGEEVAGNLARLFSEHGPPLFLKRDNGGNLNHHVVDCILSENMVIPVNSPAYYAPYNGGIEKTQFEIKHKLADRTWSSDEEFALHAALAAHDLNHRKRRCLRGRIPCSQFFGPHNTARRFTKRKRKEVYDQIIRRSSVIAALVQDACSVDTAWRIAVESWLLDHGFIAMSKTRKCYPVLSRIFAHN
jgi:hypothetical protein